MALRPTLFCAVAVALATLLNGCATHRSYAEVQSALQKREREWREHLFARYDLDALTNFLRETVAERKTLDGIDLTSSRIDPQWHVGGDSMYSGDWFFRIFDMETDYFVIRSRFKPDLRSVEFHCVRDEKTAFRIFRIVIDWPSDKLDI